MSSAIDIQSTCFNYFSNIFLLAAQSLSSGRYNIGEQGIPLKESRRDFVKTKKKASDAVPNDQKQVVMFKRTFEVLQRFHFVFFYFVLLVDLCFSYRLHRQKKNLTQQLQLPITLSKAFSLEVVHWIIRRHCYIRYG